jgi:hypothetical protein
MWTANVRAGGEGSMNNQEQSRFELVNLENRPDVIKRLQSAEQELSGLVEGDVALIAWVKKTETD